MASGEIIIIGSFVIPKGGSFGGVYSVSTSLRDNLVSRGFSVREIDTTLKDVRVTKVSKRLWSIIFRQFSFLWSILRYPKARFLFVFMSAGNSYLDKLPSIVLATILGKKVVAFPRSGHVIADFDKFYYRFLIRLSISFCSRVICQSQFWFEFFQNSGVADHKLVVVENWVSDKIIDHSAKLVPNSFARRSERFKLIFLSRIELDKGVYDVLKLAQQLTDRGSIDFVIDIYGSGSYEVQLVREIQDLGLSDIVKYRGWLDRENMLSTLNGYHLGLFLSKVEGYPNSLLDFIFAKLPVLASSIPMVRVVGRDLITYWEYGDERDLVEKVEYCYQNHSVILEQAQILYDQKKRTNNVHSVVNTLLNSL